MKAKVKETGRIIQVMNVMDADGSSVWEEIQNFSNTPKQYNLDELEFIDLPQGTQLQQKSVLFGASQGWQCPICGRVYSPTTPMCFYCSGKGETRTTTQTGGTGDMPNVTPSDFQTITKLL